MPSYKPAEMAPMPQELEPLRKYVADEFDRLTTFLNTEADFVVFRVNNVAPTRPIEGMVAFADGTNWNPGAGKGLYKYQAGAWVAL